jgi:hypothetical protein
LAPAPLASVRVAHRRQDGGRRSLGVVRREPLGALPATSRSMASPSMRLGPRAASLRERAGQSPRPSRERRRRRPSPRGLRAPPWARSRAASPGAPAKGRWRRPRAGTHSLRGAPQARAGGRRAGAAGRARGTLGSCAVVCGQRRGRSVRPPRARTGCGRSCLAPPGPAHVPARGARQPHYPVRARGWLAISSLAASLPEITASAPDTAARAPSRIPSALTMPTVEW